MSAFDGAMAALFADPNMTIAAEWRAAAGGPWRSIRVALTNAAQEIGAIGARGVALEAVLRVADLSPDTPTLGAAGKLRDAMALLKLEASATELTDAELLLRERWLAAQKLNVLAPEVAPLIEALGIEPASLIA